MDCAEGGAVNLPCNHSTISGNDYIYWYRQNPSQSPQYIIHGLKDTVANDMASLTIAADRKSSTLTLPHVTLRDAGMYYCILRDSDSSNTGKLIFGQGATLQVKPGRSECSFFWLIASAFSTSNQRLLLLGYIFLL